MSGNLFLNLLSLHKSPIPEENFFTEMIAGLLDKDRTLLTSWLDEFLNIENNYSHINVETQVEFGKLDNQLTGSRPDILITLSDEERTDYLLLESKIGSKESDNQLSKYASYLIGRYPEESKKYLVFISKNYELKDPERIIHMSMHNVMFKQFLWHDFYNFLENQSTNQPSLLLNEILDFMRRKNMSQISRITPATLSAISLFPDVYSFFQAVFDGEVTELFNKIFETKSRENLKQLQWREYTLKYDTINWHYSIGFWMDDSADRFPIIYAGFDINRNTNDFSKLSSIFSLIVDETKNKEFSWTKYLWDDPHANPGIELKKSLNEFMGEENHVLAIKHELLGFLNETKRVLEKYPTLSKSSS